jgi:predicted enzyme related to lactoylglutathione lyase
MTVRICRPPPCPPPYFAAIEISDPNNDLFHHRQGVKKTMRYLHTMLRVRNLDAALKFYQDALGLKEVRRIDNDKAKFTLVFLCAAEDEGLLKHSPKNRGAPLVELTYNWDEEK